jgi:hypothetical protein
LSAQERKASSTYELECLAVLFGTEKFRKHIELQDFILETDNQALSWLLSRSSTTWNDLTPGGENIGVKFPGAAH